MFRGVLNVINRDLNVINEINVINVINKIILNVIMYYRNHINVILL